MRNKNEYNLQEPIQYPTKMLPEVTGLAIFTFSARSFGVCKK